MADLESMSKDELIELIDDLNREIEEKDQENMLLMRKGGRGGGRDDESDVDDVLARAANDAELEDMRNKLEDYRMENSAQKDKIAELSSHLKAVEAEKLEAEADCRRLRKKADDYESQLNSVQESTRSSLRKSQDISKQQKDAQKQQLQLFQENERLQEEKADLTKKSEEYEKSVLRLEEALIAMNESREQLESEKNAAEDQNDTYLRKISELEELLDESQNKIQATAASESNWEVEASTLKNESAAQQSKYTAELSKLKEEITSLNSQMAVLKDTTSVGTKQQEIEVLRQELAENLELMDEMRELLDNADTEKTQLVQRLLEYDKNFEAQLYDKLSAEKESTRILQKKLQSTKIRLEETESRVNAGEKEKALLQREVDELNNWKSVYESGHGFQELAKHQQRLKEDNRRLIMAMEQTTEKVGEIMDSNALLMQAFEKLKADCGVDPDFYYPDQELRDDMLGENVRLRSQVNELDEQISALEKDNIRLRKTLKNQAGSVGEQGFKFQSMSADQLVKVNEFAISLRDGKLDLPLNDRSAELLAENRKLKDEAKIMTLKLEKYERDFASSRGVHDYSSSGGGLNSEDMQGVRNDLNLLMVENSGLKDRLVLMQEEILLLLGQHNQNSGSSEGIENMLLANNEMLMKELQELRIAAASSRHSPRHDYVEESRHQPPAGADPLPPTGRVAKLNLSVQTATPRIDEPHGHRAISVPQATGTPARFGAGPLGTPMYHAPQGSVRGGIAIGTPMTPHGKQLLSKTIGNLKLPPEEWTDEVKDINSQLIECLEQLYERENELYETRGVVSSLEESLVNIKGQTAVLYYDFAEKSVEWERKEKQARVELQTIIGERDDAKLKLKRTQETIDLMQREDPSELESKLRDYSKKISVFEVNEAILSRRYTALSEQLNEESAMRRSLEAEFCEMEGALKKRILFLEHNKAEVSRHVDSLQNLLDVSVPQTDYFALQTELECLREDHLAALSRELNARLGALKAEEDCRELSTIKLTLTMMDAELHGANASRRDLAAQLEHQKEATRRAVEAAAGSSTAASANELGLLVSEMARFRGEAGRLEVELVAANRRAELLREQLGKNSLFMDEVKDSVKHLQAQLDQSLVAEQASRKECLALRLKYQGGLNQDDAEKLQKKLLKVTEERESALAEVEQQSEIAEIATQQTQSMAAFRDTYMDDLKELRQHCQKLESRTDDDLLIGKLQRTLMSTKSSYKTFARKYQLLRASMRQRELAMRVMETRLDNREQAVIIMRETQRIEVSALKKAIRLISNMAEEDNIAEAEINRMIRQAANSAGEVVVDDTMALVSPRPIGAFQDESDKLNPTGFVSIGQRLLQLSKHIEDLWQYASHSAQRAEMADKKSMQWEADLEDIRVEKEILQRKCEDLSAVLSSANGKGDYKQHQSVKTIATRLSSLTDEVKSLKLSNLAHKREISTLKSQKKHLQELLGRFEDDVRDLEKIKVAGETKALLGEYHSGAQGNNQNKLKRVNGDDGDAALLEDFMRLRDSVFDAKNHPPAKQDFPTSNGNIFVGKAGENLVIDNDEFIRKLDNANNKYNESQRENTELRSRLDALSGRLAEAGDIIQEKEEQLAYCERVMEAENLPMLRNMQGEGRAIEAPTASKRQFRIMKEEQDKLQQAASATIGSLRLMLEEKNEALDKYQEKVEALQTELLESGSRKQQSVADRRADDLLKQLQAEDDRALHGNVGANASVDPNAVSVLRDNQRLLDQLENADEVMKDKARTIMQLEQKLNTSNNQRERAEDRCAASLQEMEAMKSDLLLVVQQLQASEQRVAALQRGQFVAADTTTVASRIEPELEPEKRTSGPVATNAKIKELSKMLKAKDEKLQNYRSIILRLKDEFVKAEEDRAIRDADKSMVSKGRRSGMNESGGGGALAGPELDDLRSQVSALRDGLKQAKEDLDQARRAREKLLKAKQAVEIEAEKFEGQVARAEAQAVASQEMLQRCRKDLEDSRRKEVRLRDKLREMLSAGGGIEQEPNEAAHDGRPQSANTALRRIHSSTGEDSDMHSKLQTLERDNELLKAQNQALRRAGGDVIPASGHRVLPENHEGESLQAVPSTPLELGTKEELRQQLHVKWESEKRLQKRVAVLEKRLQDKIQECEDAQVQLRKTKEALQQHSQHSNTSAAAREREKKEREDKSHRKAMSGISAADIESAQRKIFDLEDENSQLRRKCQVDMPNEIANLRFQCDSMRVRVGDLSKQLEQAQEQARKRVASSGLRGEEEQYMRLEQMRDDLDSARRQKMELEAIILEKDSRIIELSFDVETVSTDIGRYRRRTQELENYCRELNADNGKASAVVRSAWGGDGIDQSDVRGPGARFKRERDLEAVVEAMKVVVDKLKLENDRLRKGVGVNVSSAAAGDTNSRLKQDAQKKKIEALEEELAGFRSKNAKNEDSSQKLVQKTQQIASLRKAIKHKEDELAEVNRRTDEFETERETFRKTIRDAQSRIQQLELQVASRTSAREAGASVGAAASEIAEWKRKAGEAFEQVESLQQMLVQTRKELAQYRTNKGGPQNATPTSSDSRELVKLRTENEKLKKELSAFDLEFFEEIENLKYAHAEAMKKLKMYERQDSVGSRTYR